jgi:ABC-type multidrug transport system fused ATPase/permease subunit
MKNNNNFLQHKDTESKIKSNYSEYLKLTSQNVKFYSQLSLIMEILEKAIYMIIVCTFFMNTNGTDKVNFGSLLFSMNLLGMFNSSSNNVINFFTGRVEYAKMLEIYNNCINIGNKKTGGVDISQEQVREIKIKENNKTHIILNCDKAKFNGLSKIINKFYVYKKHEVFINGLETERIDSEKLNEKIISFNENSNFGYDMIGTNIQKSETIMNFIKKFGFKFVKDEEETSIENKQIKNFLLSSLLEDKIIIFDNCVQYISEQIREHIKLVIVPQISKKNFIIFNNETILNDKKEKIIFEDEPDLNNINLFNENEQENCFIN